MAHIPAAARALERDLREIFGPRLQSLVAYGLGDRHDASRDAHADAAHGDRPLTHTLAIVGAITADDLAACAGRVARWHDAGLATPLLMAAHEFEDSLDAFPLEFGAIIAD